MLQQLIERRRATDPNFRTPLLLRFIAWAFLENRRARTLQKAFVRLLGLKKARAGEQRSGRAPTELW
jgi:hypothetical protein